MMKDSTRNGLPIFLRAGWVVGCASLLLAGDPSLAQPRREVRMSAEREIGEAGMAVQNGKLELSLDEAISLALERNLSLLIERYEYSSSLLGIDQNLGIYDYLLRGSFERNGQTIPVSSALVQAGAALSQTGTTFNLGLSRLTPIGGRAELSVNNSRSATNNRTDTLNPRYGSTVTLSYDQPLLRNFGKLETERNLIIARNSSAISREQLQLRVEQVIQQISDRYWQLVEAREQLKVAEESLRLAQDLHGMNKIQVEVGTIAPLELVQSEAGVATRQEEIIRRRAAVEDGADAIRQLLNLDQGALWQAEVVPITPPETEAHSVDVEAAIRAALSARPELKRRQLENQNLKIEARHAEDQTKPQLNLETSYGFNGVKGDGRERGEDGQLGLRDRDFTDALDQALSGEFPGWRVALVLTYNLQNRTAKAQKAIADLALDQGEVTLRDLEQQIVTEVRRTARAVETAAQQIESTRVSSNLAQKNLDAERKRYENGIATSFQVLEIQEDLSQAKSREVSAKIAYRTALVNFERTAGRLLEVMNVILQGAKQ